MQSHRMPWNGTRPALLLVYPNPACHCKRADNHLHRLSQLGEVLVLLIELLLQSLQTLLLALTDGVVLVGLLAALEGITVSARQQTCSMSRLQRFVRSQRF